MNSIEIINEIEQQNIKVSMLKLNTLFDLKNQGPSEKIIKGFSNNTCNRKIKAYFLNESDSFERSPLMKFEFQNNIKDSSYFYLIGSLKLTESQIV